MNHPYTVTTDGAKLSEAMGRVEKARDIGIQCAKIFSLLISYSNIFKSRIEYDYIAVPNEYDYVNKTKYYQSYKDLENKITELFAEHSHITALIVNEFFAKSDIRCYATLSDNHLFYTVSSYQYGRMVVQIS